MHHLDQILTGIASEYLGITSLESQRFDQLDFHDLSVWQIKGALRAAFDAGAKALRPEPEPH